MKTVCVYCSSSNRIPEVYIAAARALSAAMIKGGLDLVYGGADAGLMGLVAAEIKGLGGRVVGVIPEKLSPLGWAGCDEMIVTPDMRSRKCIMEDRSDGFIALPGGFGTLEEMLEIITLKQLQFHNKPIVLLDTAGFYQGLVGLFSRIYADGFARSEFSSLYYLTEDPEDAVRYLMEYQPTIPIEKWGMERAIQR